MKTSEVIQAWKSVLSGRRPSLAIEITRECPLRCPGCYAFEDGHVGGLNLRQLQDKRGEDLVQGVLALVDEHRPLHLSLVGGDPLVRQRRIRGLGKSGKPFRVPRIKPVMRIVRRKKDVEIRVVGVRQRQLQREQRSVHCQCEQQDEPHRNRS